MSDSVEIEKEFTDSVEIQTEVHLKSIDPPKITKPKRLFLGGLKPTTIKNDIHSYFIKFGEIKHIKLQINSKTGLNKGYAFILYEDENTLQKIIDAMPHEISNWKLECKISSGGKCNEIDKIKLAAQKLFVTKLG